MSKFRNCIFLKLMQMFCKCHHKMQNDKLIYMELKNIKHGEGCNPSLGLATKARCGKVASQEGDPGVTSHAPK